MEYNKFPVLSKSYVITLGCKNLYNNLSIFIFLIKNNFI